MDSDDDEEETKDVVTKLVKTQSQITPKRKKEDSLIEKMEDLAISDDKASQASSK